MRLKCSMKLTTTLTSLRLTIVVFPHSVINAVDTETYGALQDWWMLSCQLWVCQSHKLVRFAEFEHAFWSENIHLVHLASLRVHCMYKPDASCCRTDVFKGSFDGPV